MPIIKSAKKRVRTAQKATARNSRTKRHLRRAMKAFQAVVEGGGKKAAEAYAEAQSALDTAAKKNIMHKNRVARKQSQLAKQAQAAGIKPASSTAKKATTKKPTAKKSATTKKTTTAKKVATKKTAAKKPAPKKTTAKK
ncbi:hypothetical protein BH23PAT1_BH23PAT1_0520 [soil metagenome]